MMTRRVLCRLGWHRWVVVREPDIEPYTACELCKHEKMIEYRRGRPGDLGLGGDPGGSAGAG